MLLKKSADRFESTETGQQEGLNEGFILRKNYNLQKTYNLNHGETKYSMVFIYLLIRFERFALDILPLYIEDVSNNMDHMDGS